MTTIIGLFSGANLRGAILRFSRLAEADVSESLFSGSFVYASAIWKVKGEPKEQVGIVITPKSEPEITVDNLEVAQFIYLLLNNPKVRQVIDTIGKKAVLILGRFTPERKAVLDSIRDALRQSGFLPILFDFETPGTRDTQETIVTLAGLSRFVIADITDPRSVPQELGAIVPTLPSVPVQPLLQTGHEPWGMYDHIKRYQSVLPLFEYRSQETLLSDLQQKVIAPAEKKAQELTRR